jgi:hypothetical protein
MVMLRLSVAGPQFVFDGGEHAQGLAPPPPIMEDLQVFEQDVGELDPGSPPRHAAGHPSFHDQSRPRDGGSGPGDVCAGGVKGRVGCKAFDQLAGELKA